MTPDTTLSPSPLSNHVQRLSEAVMAHRRAKSAMEAKYTAMLHAAEAHDLALDKYRDAERELARVADEWQRLTWEPHD